ncbi:MAG: hypothetical protein ACK4RK_07910 [Gemmataceae bacterium]
MMTNHRLLTYVNAEPFRPFRIHMASGRTYEIRHPEMIQVGRTTLTVFSWTTTNGKEAKEREQELSLLLVEAIEPPDASITQN